MEGKDPIKELFSQKLSNHEVPVNPELWSSIASQIPAVTTTSVATGVGLTTKLLIGISVAASLATGVYFLQSDDKNQVVKPINQTEQQSEEKQDDRINNENENPSVENKKDKVVEFKDSDKKLVVQTTQGQEENNRQITDGKDPSMNDIDVVTQTPSNSEIKAASEDIRESENKKEESSKVNDIKTNSSIENSNTSIENKSTLLPKESAIQVTLPNVFTPNGDGANDYLEITISGVVEFSLVVLDDDGRVAFQSQDSNFKWDGLLQNGDKAPQGSYVYYITGKDSEGNLVSKHSRLVIKY